MSGPRAHLTADAARVLRGLTERLKADAAPPSRAPAPLCDLSALPILWQVDAIRALKPPLAISAHRLALGMIFKDSGDAFCRGFDIFPGGARC